MEEVEGLVVYGVGAGIALSLLVVLLFLLPLAIPRPITRVRRRFWCANANEGVEVEFEEHGLPGFRRATAVLRCSWLVATGVACEHRCLDPEYRRVTSVAAARADNS